MTCDPWDVVIVPFPFTEKAGTKRRPALVLSTKVFTLNNRLIIRRSGRLSEKDRKNAAKALSLYLISQP